MIERVIPVEEATPERLAPFGRFIGRRTDVPPFASWPGVTVYGSQPIDIGSGGELLHVRMASRPFPATVDLLERHFRHTQTYLPANGRPFVMVLGIDTCAGLPDIHGLRAFVFRDSSGIAMHAGTWHDFPMALEDDTRFTVILRDEAHVDRLVVRECPMDARGPDLERYDLRTRARVTVTF